MAEYSTEGRTKIRGSRAALGGNGGESEMDYWIFTVTQHKTAGKVLTAAEIFDRRMKDCFWGLGEKTPNRRNLKKGDKAIFYIGIPEKVFAGTATLASSCFKLKNSQKDEYGHGNPFYRADYGVVLEEIDIWHNPKPVDKLVSLLEFIENKEFWFSYFQGGVRQVTEADFRTIITQGERSLVEQISTSRDIESPMEFALETHLEEFIANNWGKIGWGSELELYRSEEQDGRQFPAGIWSIDFLAIDKDTKDLVVIELKRGKTSDAIVGQLLRYINWVKENVAEKDQQVRGIIIAKDMDEALRYAVKSLDHVEVRSYKVDFELRPS